MNSSTWFVLLFLAAVNLQRVRETFQKRGTLPGEQRMQWSFRAFFILHTLIMLAALTEFLLWRKTLIVAWAATGVGLYLVSVVVRNVAIRTLGRYWSLHVEIRDQHQLVRTGIYNWVRHPAYLAIMLEVLSIPLTVNAWWTTLFAAVSYVPLLMLRLRVEERALVEKFGGDYRRYQAEVGVLLPKWPLTRNQSTDS